MFDGDWYSSEAQEWLREFDMQRTPYLIQIDSQANIRAMNPFLDSGCFGGVATISPLTAKVDKKSLIHFNGYDWKGFQRDMRCLFHERTPCTS